MFAGVGVALMAVLVGVVGYLMVRSGERADGRNGAVPEATTDTSTPESTDVSTLSPEQQEAVEEATRSLDIFPDSRQGLIDYLVNDGYTEADAATAVDSLGVDWVEQAMLASLSFVDGTSYSRERLVNQLVRADFTTEQATEGVDRADPDWNAEAAEAADELIAFDDTYTYSCYELISVLVDDEKFTEEQAEYGADTTGLC